MNLKEYGWFPSIAEETLRVLVSSFFRKGRSRGYSETTVKIRLGKFMSREGSERVKDVIPLNENVLLCFGWWILTRRTKRIVKKIDRED